MQGFYKKILPNVILTYRLFKKQKQMKIDFLSVPTQ